MNLLVEPHAGSAMVQLPTTAIDPLRTDFYNPPRFAEKQTLAPQQGSKLSMDAVEWRRCVRLSVLEGALSTAMGTLLSGVFLTAFALSLGANELHIGILAALPPLASVAQLVGARFLNTRADRKRFCISMLTISRLVWIALFAVPFIWSGPSNWAVMALMCIVGLSSVFASLAGVASLSWIRDLIPTNRRFGFLGIRSQINTVLALALAVAGGLFLDSWKTSHADSTTGYTCILAIAVVCGLIGIAVLNCLDDPKRPCGRAKGSSAARLPLYDPSFRNLVAFYICWNLANHLAAPFFVVFMLQDLGLPFWHITALHALASVAGLLTTQLWSALGRQIGTRRVIFYATLGEAFYPLCWVFLSPETTWALPLVFLFGLFNAPLAIGGQTLVMHMAPDERAPSYLASYSALIGCVTAIAAIGGGCVAQSLAAQQLTVRGMAFHGLSVVFVVSFAGRLASLMLLRRVSVSEDWAFTSTAHEVRPSLAPINEPVLSGALVSGD
jgi:MFS family permease